MKNVNILTWVFFASQGITDNTDLMRCQMLCMEIDSLGKTTTVKEIKETSGYKSCIYDIPDSLISDEKLQKMIDFNY